MFISGPPSYTGLMVVRGFLGAAEGGLLPGIVLFLSMVYKRSEMGIRLGMFDQQSWIPYQLRACLA